jgi:hypothetical protein
MNGFLKFVRIIVRDFTFAAEKIALPPCAVSDEVITFARRGICGVAICRRL